MNHYALSTQSLVNKTKGTNAELAARLGFIEGSQRTLLLILSGHSIEELSESLAMTVDELLVRVKELAIELQQELIDELKQQESK